MWDAIKEFFTDFNLEKLVKIITNPFFWLFLVLISLLLAFGIYTLIHYHPKKYKQVVAIGYNNVRIYAIHYGDEYVYSVDKRNMSKQRRESLDWFYDSFTPMERLRIVKWVEELQKEDHTVPNHLETYVKVKNVKVPVFTIVNVTSINYDKKIIHLESRLFPNLRKAKKTKKTKTYVKHYNEMPNLLLANGGKPRTLFLIKLFSTSELDRTNKQINHMMTMMLLSRLTKTLSSTRYMSVLNTNEIAIIDFALSNKQEAIATANNIVQEVNKAMYISSISNDTTFRIGVIQERHAVQDFVSLTKVAREMAIYAENTKSETKYNLYDESQSSVITDTHNGIISDIKEIIDRRLFSCTYNPVLNIKTGELIGYNCSLSAPSSVVQSINDMEEYALHYDFMEDLIVALYREVNYANKEAKPENDIFVTLDIKPVHYQAVINARKKVRTASTSETIYILKDADIEKEITSSNSFIAELKQSKLLVGLEITSTTLNISTDMLRSIDYFFIKESTFKDVLVGQNSIFFKDMLQKLSIYDAIIIATEVSTPSMIELFKTIGIEYMSSNMFGQSEKEYPVLDTKKINKLLSIKE